MRLSKGFTSFWQGALCKPILLYVLKIAKKALAEICREVIHSQVSLEKETEAHCVHALRKEMKQAKR